MDPEHVEARYRALQSLLQDHVKYGWILNLVSVPIHWFRIGPRMAIPPEREMEALAVQLLTVVLTCLDTSLKLGIIARHPPVCFALMATIYAGYGYMMVWVPKQQAHEANDFNAIVCMIMMAILNFPQRRLFLLCVIIVSMWELPSVLYFALGAVLYNDRWCHPSRLGWVSGGVQALAGGARAPEGVQACLLLGVDAAASVAYCTAFFLVIPYVVGLYFRRQYLATMFPLRAEKARGKGIKSA